VASVRAPQVVPIQIDPMKAFLHTDAPLRDAPLAPVPASGRSAAELATSTLIAAMGALLLLRLFAMAWLPLMDTTEARYAEVGRKMLELGDWITPWHDYGVAFWAKPPLSFWLTAASMKLFGVNEFAARLPHFLCMVLVAVACGRLAASRRDTSPLATIGMLAGAALSLVAAGAVMTDAALVVGTALALCGLWQALHGPRHRTGNALLFAGLAVGLLAKGPLVLVLVGLPTVAWAAWTGQVRRAMRDIPWIAGLVATAAAAGWWYLAAELKTPGFIDYFIVGEHWHRFVTPGWSGDRYGFAHAFPLGTIWLFALASTLPWPLVLLATAFTPRAARSDDAGANACADADARSWQIYLVCWSLAPLVFFTAARNIILPYALPALPAMALLASHWLQRRVGTERMHAWVAAGLALTMAGALALVIHAEHAGTFSSGSAKDVVSAWEAQRHHDAEPLVFVTERLHSASFYSAGQAEFVDTPAEALKRLARSGGFVALREDDTGKLAQFDCVTQRTSVGGFMLLHLHLPLPGDGSHACPNAAPYSGVYRGPHRAPPLRARPLGAKN
jgi:4-amino-4-deoxy-L-arabinose transferase-like glycosyltransferase